MISIDCSLDAKSELCTEILDHVIDTERLSYIKYLHEELHVEPQYADDLVYLVENHHLEKIRHIYLTAWLCKAMHQQVFTLEADFSIVIWNSPGGYVQVSVHDKKFRDSLFIFLRYMKEQIQVKYEMRIMDTVSITMHEPMSQIYFAAIVNTSGRGYIFFSGRVYTAQRDTQVLYIENLCSLV